LIRKWNQAIAMKLLMTKVTCALLLAALLSSCATTKSTIASRKQERYSAYAALSDDFKREVDQGHVKVGMPTDAVYIAWGGPTQVAQGGAAAGESTTWMYQTDYTVDTSYYGYHRMYSGYVWRSYVRADVTFVNGLVVQWHTFPQPTY
jgi:hypothetical protein